MAITLKSACSLNTYLPQKIPQKGESSKKKHLVNVILEGSYSPPSSPDPDKEVLNIGSFPKLVISFSNQDFEGIDSNHNEALVITLDVVDNEVKRILVNNGSSINILFRHTHTRMQLGSVWINNCSENPLYGFGHSMVLIKGTLYLAVTFGSTPRQLASKIKFYAVNAHSLYNIFLSRPMLTTIQAVTSTPHLKIKFPTPSGVGEVWGDQETTEKCYGQALLVVETELGKRKMIALVRSANQKKHRPRTLTRISDEV